MAKIDVKFMKGNRQTIKAAGSTYKKNTTTKGTSRKKSTSKKR